MPKIVPMQKEHMEKIMAQNKSGSFGFSMPEQKIEALVKAGNCFAAVDDDDSVLGCGGIVLYWEGRAEAWTILAENKTDKFIHVFRGVKRFVENSPVARIEATIDVDFKEAHRWIKLLGFRLEAERMKRFTPDGRDCALYAKVREN